LFFKLEEILLFFISTFLSLKETGQQFWKCRGWKRDAGVQGGDIIFAFLSNQAKNGWRVLYNAEFDYIFQRPTLCGSSLMNF